MNNKIMEILGPSGRMLSASKGRYTFNNPNNIVIFNANIFNSKKEKIWYGDLDLSSKDIDNINKLAIELKNTLYILREMDGRFEYKNNPKLKAAIYKTNKKGFSFNKDLKLMCINGIHYYSKEPFKKQIRLPKHADKDYKEEEFIIKIKINPEKYKNDPFNKLYEFLDDRLINLNYTKEDLQSILLYCTKETENALLKIVEQFLIKKHKLKKGSYDLESTLSWAVLDLPFCFSGSLQGPAWAKKDYIYIKFR
jgi:hypothetical protein